MLLGWLGSLVAVCSLSHALGGEVAHAAAPRLMMVHGEPLSERIVLANHADNLTILLGEATELTPDERSARPHLQVALFWGPKWEAYVRGERLMELSSDMADQHARLYQAGGNVAAVLCLDSPGKCSLITSAGMDVLERAGVPTRVEGSVYASTTPHVPFWLMLLILIGASALAVASVGSLTRRRPRQDISHIRA